MTKFSKKVLAAAVSAGLCGAAGAAEKVPTLGDILTASGITVTGFVDATYMKYSEKFTNVGTFRPYDTETNGFNLQGVDVAIGYQPASGFGGFVQLDFGSDAKVNGGATAGSTADDVEVQEAYLQHAAGALTVIAGKFATLAGYEVLESTANVNISRSYLFWLAEPATHTGVRGTFTMSDALKFIVGVNNGWDVLKETAQAAAADGQRADGKTLELGVAATLAKPLTLSAAFYSGNESAGTTQPANRTLLDLVLTYNLSDALTFVLAYDKGKQEKVAGTDAEWDGFAAYVNYMLGKDYRLSLRTEIFNDDQGYRTAGPTNQELKETTLTFAYMPAKNVELRAEYRKDTADTAAFAKPDGTFDKDMSSIGLQALYKF